MRREACATASTNARERDWLGRLRRVGNSRGEAHSKALDDWRFLGIKMRVRSFGNGFYFKLMNEIIDLNVCGEF
jgi:hypothetical protein